MTGGMYGVNQLPLEVSRKKKESLLLEPPHMVLKALSLLALRISPSVYEGVFGKLVCGTKVATPIRSWFCNVALLGA